MINTEDLEHLLDTGMSAAQPAETSELMERLEDCQMTLGSMATNHYRRAWLLMTYAKANQRWPIIRYWTELSAGVIS